VLLYMYLYGQIIYLSKYLLVLQIKIIHREVGRFVWCKYFVRSVGNESLKFDSVRVIDTTRQPQLVCSVLCLELRSPAIIIELCRTVDSLLYRSQHSTIVWLISAYDHNIGLLFMFIKTATASKVQTLESRDRL